MTIGFLTPLYFLRAGALMSLPALLPPHLYLLYFFQQRSSQKSLVYIL